MPAKQGNMGNPQHSTIDIAGQTKACEYSHK